MSNSRWTFAALLVGFIAGVLMSATPSIPAEHPPRAPIHVNISAVAGTDCQPAGQHHRCCGALHCAVGIAAQEAAPLIAAANAGPVGLDRDAAPFIVINQLDRPPKS